MPTTARSLASTTISQPAARMRSPPAPKNWRDGSRRRSASISCAPYISPEASPAETRICTEALYLGRYFPLRQTGGTFSSGAGVSGILLGIVGGNGERVFDFDCSP